MTLQELAQRIKDTPEGQRGEMLKSLVLENPGLIAEVLADPAVAAAAIQAVGNLAMQAQNKDGALN